MAHDFLPTVDVVMPPLRGTASRGRVLPLVTAGAAGQRRSLTVWADDDSAADLWRAGLADEGLLAARAEGAPAPADAHVLFITSGLAAQLLRLRERRLLAPAQPLLVVCRGLRDLDQVLALEMGADDVIDTQVGAPVVAARLRALWRRQEPGRTGPQALPRELRFGALRLLALERRVLLAECSVPLTEGEFEVLWLLASQAGQAVSRREILRRVRGLDDHPMDRSIDSRIYRIRAKLGDRSGASQRIRTVRNHGYAFSPAGW